MIYVSCFLFLFTTGKSPATKRAPSNGSPALHSPVLLLSGSWDIPTAVKVSFISPPSSATLYQWAGLLLLSQRPI